jgi:hypothetical protein
VCVKETLLLLWFVSGFFIRAGRFGSFHAGAHIRRRRGAPQRTVSRSIWLLGESGLVVDGSQVFHLFFFLFFFFLFLSPPHSATPYQLVIFLFGLSRSMGNCLFPLVFFFFLFIFTNETVLTNESLNEKNDDGTDLLVNWPFR